MVSIDVIIPSYRLLSEYLLPIVQMDIPPETQVRYFIIADNPLINTPVELIPLIDNQKIHLTRNSKNIGVCRTRNAGIDKATADWVLFIDDDVKPAKNLLSVYLQAIKEKPDEIGFFGEVVFPTPVNLFTRGLAASYMLTFFSIAKHIKHLKWAPTPNVIIRRSSIGNIRFDDIFDKFGAGEEIDFFLKIYRTTGKELCSEKNAVVYHNWWYNGKRTYTRFMRWAGGFTIIMNNFPEYSFYNFPNIIETLLIGLPIILLLSFCLHSPWLLVCFLAGLIMGECSIEFLNLFIHKGLKKSLYAVESSLLRASMDIGRLVTQFKYHKVTGQFCKRFDHFCDGKHSGRARFWAGLKFIAYILITVGLYLKLR